MTEIEWRKSAHPQPILERARLAGVASERKCWLYVIATFRQFWPELLYDGSRQAVGIMEQVIHGLAGDREWREAMRVAESALHQAEDDYSRLAGYRDVANSVVGGACNWARSLHNALTSRDGLSAARSVAWASELASGSQPSTNAALLRDLFGPLPFRLFSPLDAALLGWNDNTISTLAAVIDRDGAFDLLPVLADALEEAGCEDGVLLGHCRSPGPHVHGCWAVDFVLARN